MTTESDDEHVPDATEALTPGTKGVEDQSEGSNPGGNGSETGFEEWYQRLKPLLGYLPTGTHEEDTERDGFLSYSVEVHSSIIGLSIGATSATAGEMQLVMLLVTVALGVGRVQQQFSETVRSQIVKEPWYALGAAALGYVAGYVSQTGQLPPIPV